MTRPITCDEVDAVVVSRGWRVGSGPRPQALEPQMRERGMTDAEVIAELAEIEAVTLERRSAAWERGDLVELDGRLGVVVAIGGGGIGDDHPDVPEDHIAVWFGDSQGDRKSRSGADNHPEIWTVPAERFVAAAPPVWKH